MARWSRAERRRCPADNADLDLEDDAEFDDFDVEDDSSLGLMDDNSEALTDIDASGASVNTGQVDWCVPALLCWRHQP